MAESGIYEIVNLVNGKRYVGSALKFQQRWRQHRCELGKGRHNPHLQAAWNKYGPEAFVYRVLEIVDDPNRLIEREQHYIDTLKPEYNIAKKAGSNLGMKWSEETIARMSAANREIWQRPGHREKMSEAHRGQRPSPEQRAKMSAALKGRKLSPEHREMNAKRLRELNRSQEHRARTSARCKGVPKSPETIAKISAARKGQPAHNRGKPQSAEQRAKQSAIMKRKCADPAYRAMISAATKAGMARRKVAGSK